MKPRFVLDAWAVLALLQGEEPAASRVSQLLSDAQEDTSELFMSIINVGEVTYIVGKVRGEHEAWKTLDQIRQLPLTIVPAAEETVFAAVGLKIRHAISYADAFAAATADQVRATLVTGDPELMQLKDDLPVEQLQRR
jgi:predicted nucleic acid-binding protein